MKIFVLGSSQTGKSTITRYLCEKFNMTHIQSSTMIRNTFPFKEEDYNNKQEFINAITKYSIELNIKKPNIVSDYIKKNYDLNNVIIEGIRNPNNFHQLFDITKDKVIYLDYLNNTIEKTNFEKGLEVIINYLEWNLSLNILDKDKVSFIKYKTYEELEEKIKLLKI